MKNRTRKVIIGLVSASMLGVTLGAPPVTASAHAQTDVDQEKVEDVTSYNGETIGSYLTEEDKIFLDKLEDVYPYFSLDDEGALSLELEYSKLQSDYGFTEEEIEKLDSAILEQNLGISYVNQDETTVQPQVYVEDWKIYFTTDEVRMYLGSAIQAGAPAVIASIASLGSTVPGIGTVIGAAAGLWAGSEILYHATQALANEQGFYIGITWNGAFPNPDIGN